MLGGAVVALVGFALYSGAKLGAMQPSSQLLGDDTGAQSWGNVQPSSRLSSEFIKVVRRLGSHHLAPR